MKKEQTQDAVIMVRLPQDEKDLIEKAAQFDERTVNAWCRIALRKTAEPFRHMPPEA